MECPNPECHKNLEGVRKTLYGPDGVVWGEASILVRAEVEASP